MTKPLRRQARRARGAAKEEGIHKQDVDQLSGEPARLAVHKLAARLVAAAYRRLQ